jgi:hypothetical protein
VPTLARAKARRNEQVAPWEVQVSLRPESEATRGVAGCHARRNGSERFTRPLVDLGGMNLWLITMSLRRSPVMRRIASRISGLPVDAEPLVASRETRKLDDHDTTRGEPDLQDPWRLTSLIIW